MPPKPPNLFFMLQPVWDMRGKDWPKRRVRSDTSVKLRDNLVDLRLRDWDAQRHRQTTTTQTTIRLTTR